jgi:formyltetrahydrofolate deformylase
MARSVFTYHPKKWDPLQMEDDFESLGQRFSALQNNLHLPGLHPKPKVGLAFSKTYHCVTELLHRYESDELPCEITVAVSNHPLSDDSFLRRLLRRHKIRFLYIPATAADRREDDVLEAIKGTDMLVLARYMQILSPEFLEEYSKDIINIHHGLLPSFKGANPYKQAYNAGVKIIGATAHFITDKLDEGPIISQLTERVSHRDSLTSFRHLTKALERQCLYDAVSYYLDHKIQRYSKGRVAVLN